MAELIEYEIPMSHCQKCGQEYKGGDRITALLNPDDPLSSKHNHDSCPDVKASY